jgi:hydroxymethylpyrimidine pyrophosphatase-like HAD family hydrolase
LRSSELALRRSLLRTATVGPMPARRFDAVITDIDGCLGPESTAPMEAAKLAQIEAWNRAAISKGDHPIVTVCSGRPQPYAEAICRIIGNSALPCVCEMGVWLYDPHDNSYIMDPQIQPDHLDAVNAAMRWVDRELSKDGVVYQPGKTASMSLWHPDTDFLMSLLPRIHEKVKRERWPLRISRTVAWINCDLEFVSKKTGIARLLARCGFMKERLVGVGDTLGDMAIRESVGFFACPANADAELKKSADFVSQHSEVDGVLDILTRIL